MRLRSSVPFFLSLALMGGCDTTETPDGGTDAGTSDTPMADGGGSDTGIDAGGTDGGGTDAGMDAGTDAPPPPPTPPSGYDLVVAGNGGASAGTIDRRLSDTLVGDETGTFTGATNEGIFFDSLGQLVQAGDGASPLASGIRTFCAPIARLNDATDGFDAATDRALTSASLMGAKGVISIDSVGWYVVAANGSSNIQVYSQSAAGAVTPLFTAALGASTSVWDVEYDAAADRLFAALTNGSIAVYDDFARDRTATPDRTFTQNTAVASITNFHGMAYDAATDTLIVTDVGAATMAMSTDFATDGSIVVFAGASTLSGAVDADQVIAGPATMLGNPVDSILIEGTLYVAEKAGDVILAWVDITTLGSGDIEPTVAEAAIKPESVASLAVGFDAPADVSDLDTASPIDFVFVAQNPAPTTAGTIPAAGSFLLRAFTPALPAGDAADFRVDDAILVGPNTRLLENVAFDPLGNAYATFDNGQAGGALAGGILVANHISLRDGELADTGVSDRIISGAATGLVHPKGIELAADAGLIMVADFGNNSIRVFSACASGNVAPAFVVSNLGTTTNVWDLDYDPDADRLYVAATNGTVLVYDAFVASAGTDDGPDRVINVMHVGGAPAVNLHGIIHDAVTNQLYLSDVGAASGTGADTDGAIYRVTNASTASGNVIVAGEISGALSQLGNPVDIAFDGSDLFVAEKANAGGRLLRFDDIATLTGVNDVAADASTTAVAPESVTLLPSTFASQTAP